MNKKDEKDFDLRKTSKKIIAIIVTLILGLTSMSFAVYYEHVQISNLTNLNENYTEKISILENETSAKLLKKLSSDQQNITLLKSELNSSSNKNLQLLQELSSLNQTDQKIQGILNMSDFALFSPLQDNVKASQPAYDSVNLNYSGVLIVSGHAKADFELVFTSFNPGLPAIYKNITKNSEFSINIPVIGKVGGYNTYTITIKNKEFHFWIDDPSASITMTVGENY